MDCIPTDPAQMTPAQLESLRIERRKLTSDMQTAALKNALDVIRMPPGKDPVAMQHKRMKLEVVVTRAELNKTRAEKAQALDALVSTTRRLDEATTPPAITVTTPATKKRKLTPAQKRKASEYGRRARASLDQKQEKAVLDYYNEMHVTGTATRAREKTVKHFKHEGVELSTGTVRRLVEKNR